MENNYFMTRVKPQNMTGWNAVCYFNVVLDSFSEFEGLETKWNVFKQVRMPKLPTPSQHHVSSC